MSEATATGKKDQHEQAFNKWECARRATLPALHKAERAYFDAQHTEHEESKLHALMAAQTECRAACARADEVLAAEQRKIEASESKS
jgi:hypothetical protein